MARKILRHKWDVEYRRGRFHTLKMMTCRVCGVRGHKSMMDTVRPCLGAKHTPECMANFGYMRCGPRCRCEGPGAVWIGDVDEAKRARRSPS